MAYKKLKDMVSSAIDEDGRMVTTPRYGKPPTITINVETTGKLRLFTFVPEFMGALVGTFTHRGTYGEVQCTTITEKKGGAERWAIVGRDPDDIESAWKALCKRYETEVASADLEPVIRIRHERDRFASHRGENAANLQVDFERYLHNRREPTGPRDDVSDYNWSDDGKPTSKRSRYNSSEWTRVPYTPELWARLVDLRDRIRAAQQQYDEMVRSGAIVDRLLQGPSMLALPTSLEESA